MDIHGLRARLGDEARENEPMANHTTYHIGGPADLFVVAHTAADLRRYVALAQETQVPCFILGGGANLLVADKGIRGLVIQNRCAGSRVAADGDGRWLLEVGAGAELRSVAREMIEQGLCGLEWAVGVPGTIGGAVVGNAGAYGGYVSDSLRGVKVYSRTSGGEEWWPHQQLRLGYRSSLWKSNSDASRDAVILSATFALRMGNRQELEAQAAQYTDRRAERQPAGWSCGSVFKRTDQYPAGFLIENAGLKGVRIGGAVISPVHANFILNEGGATAQDVRELIDLARRTVWEKFQQRLELEVELVGEW